MKIILPLALILLFSCQKDQDPIAAQNAISVDFEKNETVGFIQSQLEGSWKVVKFSGGWCLNCHVINKELMTWHQGNFTWMRADTLVATGLIDWKVTQMPLGNLKWTMTNFGLTPDDIRHDTLSLNRDWIPVDGVEYLLVRK